MQRVVILGGGESGVGAAILAKQNNLDVFVSEYGIIQEIHKKDLIQHKVGFEEGGHSFDIIEKAELIIKSPGIPEQAKIIREIREKGLPIISEIEFAYSFCKGKIIGITGSNGKTTTTLLTHHILHEAGLNVGVGGNIGNSFARLLAEKAACDIYVLELSSFQLDDIKTFSPNIAVILNITADHLDRYNQEMEVYGQSKFLITANQCSDDLLILNGDDYWTQRLKSNMEIKAEELSITKDNYENGLLTTVRANTFETKEFSLRGEHNFFNMLSAIEICEAIGVSKINISKALKTFRNAPHRLEVIASIDGVEYINDSKATNVESVYFALKAMERPIIWIAGGKDKGNDYSAIESLVEEKVKAMICLGLDNEKLLDAFTPIVKIIEESTDMEESLRLAAMYADEGDVVLLSPACASFDLFDNYKHRGEEFTKATFRLLK